MKTTILKYIVLLAALLISVYVLVKKYSFTYNMLFIVSGLLILYVIIQTLEQIRNKKEKKMPANGFLYYTPGVITKKVIKIGAFIIAATVLLYSDNKVLLFGLVLAGIILADIISLIMELKNNRYFVYFDDKAIVVTFEDKRIYPSHVSQIEFRYDNFYLTLKNNSVRMLELDKLKESDRKPFSVAFVNWATTNEVKFTDEAKVKLGLS